MKYYIISITYVLIYFKLNQYKIKTMLIKFQNVSLLSIILYNFYFLIYFKFDRYKIKTMLIKFQNVSYNM